MSKNFNQIFPDPKPIIGCIHVHALPGTPAYRNNWDFVVKRAVEEALILAEAGFGGLIIENMHDAPYLKREVGPEITASMTVLSKEIRRAVDLPVGIQILAGANKAALACAKAAGLDFIRAEGFVFAHVADEGMIESDAGALLRYRKMIGAEEIAIFTDIQKKHSAHAITSDLSIADWAKAAAFFKADGLVVTGSHTGQPASVKDIQEAKKNCNLPVLVGSGVTLDNLDKYRKAADAIIIGSWYKKDGFWANEIDLERAKELGARARIK